MPALEDGGYQGSWTLTRLRIFLLLKQPFTVQNLVKWEQDDLREVIGFGEDTIVFVPDNSPTQFAHDIKFLADVISTYHPMGLTLTGFSSDESIVKFIWSAEGLSDASATSEDE